MKINRFILKFMIKIIKKAPEIYQKSPEKVTRNHAKVTRPKNAKKHVFYIVFCTDHAKITRADHGKITHFCKMSVHCFLSFFVTKTILVICNHSRFSNPNLIKESNLAYARLPSPPAKSLSKRLYIF